jgi:hypothetical protein
MWRITINVILLGAGASKAYTQSKTKLKMPIAKDFFETYSKLDISERPDVLVGHLINYLKKYHNMSVQDFLSYSEDIEVMHSEIGDKVINYAKQSKHYFQGDNFKEKFLAYKAYMEILFLFNSVINEIQNGDISKPHQNIARKISSDDVILTFNWDTLLDMALENVTSWKVSSGYFIKQRAIYNDGWTEVDDRQVNDAPLLIKLHGSTNWLTSYMTIEEGNWRLTQELSSDILYVYRHTLNPYDTFRGRYWSGYEPFSYGYYPPNIPDREHVPERYHIYKTEFNYDLRIKNNISGTAGLDSMPAIIPPVKKKEYDLFGNVFDGLWRKAEECLAKADKIIIIGYSFPKTDYRTNDLFKRAFCQRTSKPEIVIVNPMPDELKYKFIYEYGIDDELIKIERVYFDEKFDFASVYSR